MLIINKLLIQLKDVIIEKREMQATFTDLLCRRKVLIL